MPPGDLIAGVELGGTKALAVLTRGQEIIARLRVNTTTPDETLGALRSQLERWRSHEGFSALGIASFGPIRVDISATDFGHMLSTPKAGWSGVDIAGKLAAGLDRPYALDTDVNAAALAEWRWGAGQGVGSLCYLTIGTGVGGGLVINGEAIHGALHPEVGHVRLRRATRDVFPGICPFHGDCIEGLISGPALRARFGKAAELLEDHDPRWVFAGHDLAMLIGTIALTTSPQRVLVGGGVGIGQPALLGHARATLIEQLAGYLPHVNISSVAAFVKKPFLGEDAGALGATALGYIALERGRSCGKG